MEYTSLTLAPHRRSTPGWAQPETRAAGDYEGIEGVERKRFRIAGARRRSVPRPEGAQNGRDARRAPSGLRGVLKGTPQEDARCPTTQIGRFQRLFSASDEGVESDDRSLGPERVRRPRQERRHVGGQHDQERDPEPDLHRGLLDDMDFNSPGAAPMRSRSRASFKRTISF